MEVLLSVTVRSPTADGTTYPKVTMLILAFSFEKRIACTVAGDQSGCKVVPLPRIGSNSLSPVERRCVPFEECYLEVSYWSFENNLHVTGRRSKNNLSRTALIRENGVAEPEGAPQPGENEIGFQEVTNACDAMLNLSPAARQAAMIPSSCSKHLARHISRSSCRRSLHVRKRGRSRGS
jgi:hypothetical protein